jgi:hypothetical protein
MISQRIWQTWRATKILKRYSAEQKEDLKKKMIALDFVHGRRAHWFFPFFSFFLVTIFSLCGPI